MDEKKTYLIEIQSNYQEYIDNLIQAKKRVDELRTSNEALRKSENATADQIEKSNAELRQAQTDVKNATNLVNLATKANKAESGSYEQLLRNNQLWQTALKLEAGTMTKNIDGTYRMTDKYIQLSRQVNESKKALDQFGKGIHDNRLNVGNYSESIQGALGNLSLMPGVLGRAGMAAQSFVMSFSKVGLIGGIIAGVLAAISAPFMAFFKWSQEGMDLLAQKTSAFKAALTVLKGELIEVGKGAVKSIEETGKQGNVITKIMGDIGNAAKGIFNILYAPFPKVKEYLTDLGTKMNNAADSAANLKKQEQELEAEEIRMIVPRAKANLAIKEARLLYADQTKTYEVRMEALKKALDLENKTTDQEIVLQTKRYNILLGNQKRIKDAHQDTREIDRQVAETEAKIFELRTVSAGKEIRATKALQTARHELLMESFKLVEAETKLNELANQADIEAYNFQKKILKTAYDEQVATVGKSFEEREQLRKDYLATDAALDAQILQKQKENLTEQMQIQTKLVDTIIQPFELARAAKLIIYQTYLNAIQKLDEDAIIKTISTDETERNRKREQQKTDLKAGFDYQRLKAENEQKNAKETSKILESILDDEHAAMIKSVEYEKLTANQKKLIDEQYTAAKKQLSEKRKEFAYSEIKAIAGAATAMSEVLGRQTALAKGFAVAGALMDTFAAATATLNDKTIPSTVAKIAMMATVILTGLANVQSILAVDTSGKSTSVPTSAPKTITNAPAIQRIFANPVGSSVLTQPAVTQAQINALPNQNLLTAEDIAKAMSKLPSPIVTVEDINAKIKEKQKIEVRAKI